MVNFLNHKRRVALILLMACVSLNNAWGMEKKEEEEDEPPQSEITQIILLTQEELVSRFGDYTSPKEFADQVSGLQPKEFISLAKSLEPQKLERLIESLTEAEFHRVSPDKDRKEFIDSIRKNRKLTSPSPRPNQEEPQKISACAKALSEHNLKKSPSTLEELQTLADAAPAGTPPGTPKTHKKRPSLQQSPLKADSVAPAAPESPESPRATPVPLRRFKDKTSQAPAPSATASTRTNISDDSCKKVSDASHPQTSPQSPSLRPKNNSEIRYLKFEALTAAIRFAAIILNQIRKDKYGPNSKKALISGIVADLARLINDGMSFKNELAAYHKQEKKNESVKYTYYADLVAILPMVCNITDIVIKAKKLFNKNYSTQKQLSKDATITKAIDMINKFVPFIEGILAFARVGAKCIKQDYDPAFKKHAIQMCITYLTIARILEFYAERNGSSKSLVLVLSIVALAVAAEIKDFVEIWKWDIKNRNTHPRRYIEMRSFTSPRCDEDS